MNNLHSFNDFLNEYGGSEWSAITAKKNFLYIEMGKFRDELQDRNMIKDFDKAKKKFWDVVGVIAEEHHELYESKVNEASYSDHSISDIAAEISDDWNKISPHAAPYLDAMGDLENITDMYFMDSGVCIVAYFLSNAQTWRGSVAKDIKKELNKRLKDNRR